MSERYHEEEEGVEIPLDRITPEILQALLSDFVSREWSELSDAGFTHEDKVEQVHQQLKEGKAKILFDLSSNTWNIISEDCGRRMPDGE